MVCITHENHGCVWYESVADSGIITQWHIGGWSPKGSVHGACRVSSHIWHVGFETWIHSPVWNVCVTMTRSCACAPRWGVALVGFVSARCISSPRCGTPISSIKHTRQTVHLRGRDLEAVPDCVLDFMFCICMRTE